MKVLTVDLSSPTHPQPTNRPNFRQNLRYDFIIVMKVLTVDLIPPPPPPKPPKDPTSGKIYDKNGDVLLAHCVAKGQ